MEIQDISINGSVPIDVGLELSLCEAMFVLKPHYSHRNIGNLSSNAQEHVAHAHVTAPEGFSPQSIVKAIPSNLICNSLR